MIFDGETRNHSFGPSCICRKLFLAIEIESKVTFLGIVSLMSRFKSEVRLLLLLAR